MVLFCRLRNASAPALIASEISRIFAVPVSRWRTFLISQSAKSRPKILMPSISVSSMLLGILLSVVCCWECARLNCRMTPALLVCARPDGLVHHSQDFLEFQKDLDASPRFDPG